MSVFKENFVRLFVWYFISASLLEYWEEFVHFVASHSPCILNMLEPLDYLVIGNVTEVAVLGQ
jgi:hypothetical protein